MTDTSTQNANQIDLNTLTPEQRQQFVDLMNNAEPHPKPFIPNQPPVDELPTSDELPHIEPILEETGKHWSKSKTMWFNAGVTALGVASTILPFAKPFIKPKHYGILTTAIGVGNMLLRAVTKDKLTK